MQVWLDKQTSANCCLVLKQVDYKSTKNGYKTTAITGYLTQGTGYRQLAARNGVSRTTINKWVMIHQGIHNIAPTEKQIKYYLSGMNSKPENVCANEFKNQQELE